MVNVPPSQPNPGLFAIPPAAVARHPGALLGPRELRRWVDGLPLGNPPKAAQMLLQQLRLLVRDPGPDTRMHHLLPIYAVPVNRLFEIVEDRLRANSDSVVPLDQLEYTMVELLSELAFGHLRSANELLAKAKQPTAETLYQAMRLLEGAHNIQRLRYHRLLPDNWRLLMQIYLHAEAQGTAQESVDRKLRGAEDPATMEGLFFRALIISLCDPHHHRPEDILNWHRWTGGHADVIELGILPQGPFAIPLDISGELAPLTAARRGKPGPDMRYLGIESFLQRLEQDPAAPKGLLQALNDLITGRKSPEQRRSPRQPRDHAFSLLHGLRGIHARLDALTRGADNGAPAPPALDCRQVNQSKTGAAFHLSGPVNPPLSVDDLILAESATSPGPGAAVGFVGRIRRIVALGDQAIEIGVEKLQGRLIPVVISGSAAERVRGNTLALLQHAVDSDAYTLIATRTLFREGDTIKVEGSSADYGLRLQRLLGVAQQTAYIAVELADR